MASGLLLDADRISKGKSKWGEGNKVYTRRFKRISGASSTPSATLTAEVVSLPVTKLGEPTTPNNDQTVGTEHANSEIQQVSAVVEPSNEQLVESREVTRNGVVKPVVVVVDGLVKINLKGANKDEIVELMGTMKAELENVRRVAQKLEDKEAELTASLNVGVGGDGDGEAYNHSQYLGDDMVDRRALFRVNSEVGSVSNGVIRPFRQLSVSVGNNNHGVGEFMEKEKRTPKANPYYQSSEFLLGKDRLPSESNKRHKSNSGRKHSKESDRVWNRTFKSCNNLLQRLMKHKFGWVFNEPVNAKMLGLHDYHDIIKHPMDLGTVKSRLAQNFYKSPMEFADDVRLTFRNAMTYNPKGQDVHLMAEQLLNLFEERWAVIESEFNPTSRYAMIYDPSTPTPTSRKAPHFAHAPLMLQRSESVSVPVVNRSISAPTGRTPVPKKPKAKDPNKRNMTYEEKQKLSTNLQSLPSEKLDNIIQIIKKNTSVSQHDDEIEVDIDSVDIETLWELDRFVTNYRKNLSKHKRKAALAQQARAEAHDVNQTMNPSKSNPDDPKEDKITEENTIAGRPVDQGERGGDNATSSSSSSSDSGSSSSDSDSDSSSEDGSDAGQSPRS
ncbi:putative chromatin remodeler Bromodomain family [Helianthus annuus]|uniref:Chromatin remodeler Bromodomain family n=1 Tax=Helianthus annuus TaxID=4232 RepID=A0A9K3E5M2_HELAN|nr:transcription factor GTE4 isoform X1 [Helianthus annuus]KAF5766568.1 putative chromatin remodeler Bromodomain family [Helianthus annuus]KAJ0474845.1 putative chromatin remodeler Bromodomain family [Helianthus annuus]KAJ0650400.1 putative chromatin remodeler Bromodomain family [Helianthus annuus]KAJ0654164.1 putative chromatin remodeler Bromodomain family [Helianthus annuus]KAJ0846805.1 putative chromatin remodeler Bromodomain family [Helianthus annuus]